jgi:hypothetical protein
MTKTAKIVLGVFGGLVLLIIVVGATGCYMVMSAFDSRETSQQEAVAAFTEMRAKFPGVKPALTFGPEGPGIARTPPDTSTAKPPSTVHVLFFDQTERRLTRVHLPLSLLKLTNSPFEFNNVEMDIGDIERYGSTVLLDGDTPDGDPIFVWTD